MCAGEQAMRGKKPRTGRDPGPRYRVPGQFRQAVERLLAFRAGRGTVAGLARWATVP